MFVLFQFCFSFISDVTTALVTARVSEIHVVVIVRLITYDHFMFFAYSVVFAFMREILFLGKYKGALGHSNEVVGWLWNEVVPNSCRATVEVRVVVAEKNLWYFRCEIWSVDREWGGPVALFCAPYKKIFILCVCVCVWKWLILMYLTHFKKSHLQIPGSVVTSRLIIGEALPVATTKIIGEHAPLPP